MHIIDLTYIPNGKLAQLNEYTAKYTYFSNIKELLSPDNNYRAVLYHDPLMSHSAQRELDELAKVYDEYMIRTNDSRRLYRV